MRVIAGEMRGRRLHAPPGDQVRPTPDRVREALFSILGPGALDDTYVLDLFCGTGALAIEALSRGAAHATLVDTDIRAARRNIEALGLEDRTDLVRADATDFLRSGRDQFHFVFCDPPYKLGDRLTKPLSQLVPNRLRPDGRFIVESPTKNPMTIDTLDELTVRRYGSTTIAIYGNQRQEPQE